MRMFLAVFILLSGLLLELSVRVKFATILGTISYSVAMEFLKLPGFWQAIWEVTFNIGLASVVVLLLNVIAFFFKKNTGSFTLYFLPIFAIIEFVDIVNLLDSQENLISNLGDLLSLKIFSSKGDINLFVMFVNNL